MLPEDHYGAIYELFSTSNNIRTRSLAIGVLLSNEALRKQQTLLDKLVEYI